MQTQFRDCSWVESMVDCTITLSVQPTLPAIVDAAIPWQATKMCNRKKNCIACMRLRLGHCFPISTFLVGFSTQKSSSLCSSALSRACLTRGRGAPAWLAGGLVGSVEGLGLGKAG